ncbi:lipoate--protein ligase family protein [Candidatus Bipolaricaulota sp. J31]
MRVIIDFSLRDPAENLALEEAILRSYGADKVPPTLRIWRNPRCVVIGRGQRPEDEADLEFCRRHRIPVIKRPSGGGAVYHHPGNLNFSLFLPLDGPWRDVRRAHELVGELLAAALEERLGLRAEVGEGSIFVEGLKISGMAQYRRRGLLYHGTLLLWDDRVPMNRVLLALRPGYSPSGVPSKPSPTGSLSGILGREVSLEEGVRLLLAAFRPLGRFGREEISLREWALAWSILPEYRSP